MIPIFTGTGSGFHRYRPPVIPAEAGISGAGNQYPKFSPTRKTFIRPLTGDLLVITV